MKAYKFEVVVIDFESYGEEEIKRQIEDSKYLSTHVKPKGSADIGEWHDDHPLNKSATHEQAYSDLVFNINAM